MEARPAPYLGYNFAGRIHGDFIPQRLQNLCIRDYAARHGLVLSISVAEYFDARAALMLFAQLEHTGAVAGFVFFSLALLPAERERRHDFYDRVARGGQEVHFALEDLRQGGSLSWREVDRLYRLRFDERLEQNRRALLAFRAG